MYCIVHEMNGERFVMNSSPYFVLQYDLEGNFIREFPSLMEVKRQFGYDIRHISKCCLGKQKTSCGYLWRYKESAA